MKDGTILISEQFCSNSKWGRIEEELGNEECLVECVNFDIFMRHVNRNVNKAINYVSLDQWFRTSLSIRSTHRAWESRLLDSPQNF